MFLESTIDLFKNNETMIVLSGDLHIFFFSIANFIRFENNQNGKINENVKSYYYYQTVKFCIAT